MIRQHRRLPRGWKASPRPWLRLNRSRRTPKGFCSICRPIMQAKRSLSCRCERTASRGQLPGSGPASMSTARARCGPRIGHLALCSSTIGTNAPIASRWCSKFRTASIVVSPSSRPMTWVTGSYRGGVIMMPMSFAKIAIVTAIMMMTMKKMSTRGSAIRV